MIAATTVADLKAFHAAHYRPDTTTLVVVGDVDRKTLECCRRSRRRSASWKAASAAAPVRRCRRHRRSTKRRCSLVDKPGRAAVPLWLGRVQSPRRPISRHAADQVMNTLLGGSFTSRFNDNLREQHGYAYGAGSRFRRNLTGGLFQVATDVQTDKTGPAVGEVFKELERILTPAAADDVERARNYAALGYAGDFETTGQLAQRMVDAVVYGLPDGFYEGFVPKALAVDAAALQQAARGAIDTKKIALVVVGDRAKVEAPLRALNLGEIRNLSVDEVMGKPPAIE